MEVEELVSLVHWIETDVNQPKVVDLYAALKAAMSQPTRGYRQEKDQLYAALGKMRVHLLSLQQMDVFEIHGVEQWIGNAGANYIERIIERNGPDLVSSAADVGEAIQPLKELCTWATDLSKNLASFEAPADADDAKSTGLIRVRFQGETSISNMVELQEWSKSWLEIARGFTMAVGSAPEDLEIVGTSNGSIILKLRGPLLVMFIFSAVLKEGLEITSSIQHIRLQNEEIKSLKIANSTLEKTSDLLNKEIERIEAEGSETIVSNLPKNFEQIANADGEQLSALKKSVAGLLKFLKKGGEVELLPPSDLPTEGDPASLQERQSLIEQVHQLRQLEQKIYLLDYQREMNED